MIMKLVILILLWGNILVSQDSISVAVLDFNNNAGIDSLTVKSLTSRFQTDLVNSKAFIVIEREKMNEILREQDFHMSDLCNSDVCTVGIGQVIGATHIVTGDIANIGSVYSVNCRLMDVSTVKIVKADSRSHTGSIEGLLTLMDASALALSGTRLRLTRKE